MEINRRREMLAAQVKEEYANITASDSQQYFDMTTTNMTPHEYYGHLQSLVLEQVYNGGFDTCHTGTEIVNKVAANKSILPGWN